MSELKPDSEKKEERLSDKEKVNTEKTNAEELNAEEPNAEKPNTEEINEDPPAASEDEDFFFDDNKAVKLVAEKICQKHIVRFDSRKNMSGGCFIGLNACIVRINFTIPFRSQHKCGNNYIEHIGTCMVTDYFLSFRFQCRTEHIVGSCLSICTAGCKNSLSYL